MVGRKIKKGSTIGIVSPAFIEKPSRIAECINSMKNLGFKIKEGRHVYDRWGYFAGKDKDRAADIMEMFKDKKVDMILCVRGGYGAMRLLPYMDFNIIRKNPKIIMGYSDITVLLNSIAQETGLITFHGPTLNSNFNDQETLKSFLFSISNGNRPYEINNGDKELIAHNGKDSVDGVLAGGNLSLIVSTLGTPYEINFKDKIIFIEEVGEQPYRIDRMLTQLLLSGRLQQAKGIILGQFTDCDKKIKEEDDFNLNQVLKDRILSLNKPLFTNFMSGHDYPKLTLPIGAKIRMNFNKNCIEILEPIIR